jgi:hypothetical protein
MRIAVDRAAWVAVRHVAMVPRRALARALLVATALAVPAPVSALDFSALDFPAANVRLQLRRHPRSKTFQLVVRRPPFFPKIGGADDPAVGSPGGMLIEIISMHEGVASVVAPSGAGTPGWTPDPSENQCCSGSCTAELCD